MGGVLKIRKIIVKLQIEAQADIGETLVSAQRTAVFARRMVLMHLCSKCRVCLYPHISWNAYEVNKKGI